MKVNLKNGGIFNTSCAIGYVLLSYIFTLWYKFKFMIFNIETVSAIKFLVIYIIFMVSIFLFLKVSKSSISKVIISIFSIIYMKEYSMGPIDAILNNKFNFGTQYKSLLTFGFLAQTIIVVLNLVILFYALLKLHEQLENRNI